MLDHLPQSIGYAEPRQAKASIRSQGSIQGWDYQSCQTRYEWIVPMSVWQQTLLISPLAPKTRQEVGRTGCYDHDDDRGYHEYDRAQLQGVSNDRINVDGS